MPYLLISLGGIAGANVRYLVSRWVADRYGVGFPYGTLLINVTGGLIIGFFLTIVADRYGNNANARYLVATGFLGAYTTFSTFSYETVELFREGKPWLALAYVGVSVLVSIAGVVAGIGAASVGPWSD